MAFLTLVELYRKCGYPEVKGGAEFACNVDYMLVREQMAVLKEQSTGRFDHISVDGVNVPGDLPADGERVAFGFTLPTRSSARFYKNSDELLERASNSLSRGEMPEEFYLIEDDYSASDGDKGKPDKVKIFADVCDLINSLFKLAHYHDGKQGNSNPKLVFIGPSKNSEIKPVEIETKINSALLKDLGPLDLQIVKELSSDNAANDPHYSAKIGVFGTCLAEFVGGRQSGGAFEYLLLNWDEFSKTYHRDLSTYLSGFAFHKAKIEVAEAELKIANEFSKVLNDILGKLLGIPVSFAAVLAIQKEDGLAKQLFVVLGISVACWILSRVVANQQRQFKRIESSKDIVIGAMEGKKESYPEDLRAEVDELAQALNDNSNFLRKTLRGFWILSWLPLVIAVGYLFFIYCNDLLDCLLGLSATLGCG